MSAEHNKKLRILVNSNSNMSRGKYAAAAVHAALTAAGVHPGLPVIVLGGQRDDVLRCATVIRDAGKTEVEPGTPTAGTDWSPALSTPPDDDVREALATVVPLTDDDLLRIADRPGGINDCLRAAVTKAEIDAAAEVIAEHRAGTVYPSDRAEAHAILKAAREVSLGLVRPHGTVTDAGVEAGAWALLDRGMDLADRNPTQQVYDEAKADARAVLEAAREVSSDV